MLWLCLILLGTDVNIREQRLRPEIPKLANKDFEYTYGSKAEKEKTQEHEENVDTRIVIKPPSTSTPPPTYLVQRNYPPAREAPADAALQAAMPTQEV